MKNILAATLFLLSLTQAYAQKNNAAKNMSDPESFINPRFTEIKTDTAVKFADVTDYKGQKITLLCDIYQPAGDNSASRPVIIWIHGGGFRTGSKRTQNYVVHYGQDFAKRGFVCISIDYRLRDSKDLPVRAAELPALMDAARDANTAIEWVRKNSKKYRVDTDHIFVAGGSAGGRTAITVAEFPGPDPSARNQPETEFTSKKWNKKGIIAAAILWGGPEKEMRDWVYPYLNKKSIPAVIIHGDSDKTIPVQNSIDLNDAMQKARITTELHILPGAAHTPVGKTTDPLIEDWTARFFVNEWKKKL